ncbi:MULTISPECIES: GNAT family N-acetyltransferase [unclassified Gordonia (in: high G+C Gram-positive bacteria)]
MTAPTITVERATDPASAVAIAEVAAATFPLACPPHAQPDDIAGFIRAHLSPDNFADFVRSPESDVFLARTDGGDLLGYALVHHRDPSDPDVAAAVTARPCSEISKMYVLPDHHGRLRADPPSHLLMRAAVDRARRRGSVVVWLGVNQENVRAQRFYGKFGFARAGVKTFDLGGSIEHDYVMALPLV